MLSQRPDEKIAIIDFDGTLCKFMFPDVGPIEPNVHVALQMLRDAGYKIKIHSCRTATYWGRPDERSTHIKLISGFMRGHELPYDEIITDPTMNKPIAEVYINDRAIRYESNWLEIAKKIETYHRVCNDSKAKK